MFELRYRSLLKLFDLFLVLRIVDLFAPLVVHVFVLALESQQRVGVALEFIELFARLEFQRCCIVHVFLVEVCERPRVDSRLALAMHGFERLVFARPVRRGVLGRPVVLAAVSLVGRLLLVLARLG